ncbi:DNA-binding response regulator, OmpR family, contains REC and winged-helix (wHTH) domain [Tessaracoccus oleiagri]|uniref:DNA-binding response regulator, OmpR family, contains REC and winged-helix (WHTH) domain n=2 Tax=Tessaracoccus oleiagri TaxID=686624 RepID=A0A1G9HI51_9ACTN|nr:DNA-binding response regulator, OmpR family, contains REC and winged-helix (wHTH) domain [Tessaracoccus oleiagri]
MGPFSRAGNNGDMADTAPAKALIIDDERPLAGIVASYLRQAQFETAEAYEGPDGVRLAQELDPEVVILDLGLPGMDGVEVCRRIRTFSDCYIIMLTARVDEVDKVIGLSVGADDYLTKPFSPRELVARVQAMLRRPRRRTQPATAQAAREFGQLRIDAGGRDAWLGDEPVVLTRTEFDILDVLSARPNLALSRRQIIDEVWGPGWVGDEHVVDVHVANLRKKLDDPPAEPRYVLTVRGVGYRMGQG